MVYKSSNKFDIAKLDDTTGPKNWHSGKAEMILIGLCINYNKMFSFMYITKPECLYFSNAHELSTRLVTINMDNLLLVYYSYYY